MPIANDTFSETVIKVCYVRRILESSISLGSDLAQRGFEYAHFSVP